MKGSHPSISRRVAVSIFAVGMGYLEGVVVVYLNQIIQRISDITERDVLIGSLKFFALLNRPVIDDAKLLLVEQTREASTIVMLLTLGYLAGARLRGRLGFFLLAFCLWDLSYYMTLRYWLGWPTTLLDLDIYFLIPVPWAGPVVTPIASALIGLALAFHLIRRSEA